MRVGSELVNNISGSMSGTGRPSATLLGYGGELVEPGLPPPLVAEARWEHLKSPERNAAEMLLGRDSAF